MKAIFRHRLVRYCTYPLILVLMQLEGLIGAVRTNWHAWLVMVENSERSWKAKA